MHLLNKNNVIKIILVNIPEKQDLCKKSYKFEANCPPL